MRGDGFVSEHAVEHYIGVVDDAVDHLEIGHVGTCRDEQLAVFLRIAFAIDVEDFLSGPSFRGHDFGEQARFAYAFIGADDHNAGGVGNEGVHGYLEALLSKPILP